MTQEASQTEVPNFEAISDGKRKSTPKQWLKRFRQYTKRKYKIDIADLIRGADVTQNDWTEKKLEYKKISYGVSDTDRQSTRQKRTK